MHAEVEAFLGILAAKNPRTKAEMWAGARNINRLQEFAKWYDPITDRVRIRDTKEGTKDDRARVLFEWVRTYDIVLALYQDTQAIAVTVAGVTFVDRQEEFPSSLLFANVAVAVKSGAVEKRVGDT